MPPKQIPICMEHQKKWSSVRGILIFENGGRSLRASIPENRFVWAFWCPIRWCKSQMWKSGSIVQDVWKWGLSAHPVIPIFLGSAPPPLPPHMLKVTRKPTCYRGLWASLREKAGNGEQWMEREKMGQEGGEAGKGKQRTPENHKSYP